MLERLEDRIVLDAGPLWISEFLAANQAGLLDEDGEASDWIEIHNPTQTTVDLDGYYLTDDEDDPRQWRFPALPIEPGGHLVVFASNKDRTDPAATLHTNFRLDAGGEYLALMRPDGTTVSHAYAPGYPDQSDDVSYGLSSDGATTGFFTLPSPGGPAAEEPIDNPDRQIVVTEIMYHPASEDSQEEFIEFHNRGASTVDLTGWRITSGVDFVFPQVALAPGEYLVVAAHENTFTATNPGVFNFVAGWEGKLSNSSETIELSDSGGVRIDRVTYADEGDWATRAVGPDDRGHTGWTWRAEHDGLGASLELIQSAMPNQHGQNWTSGPAGGTPGRANQSARDDIAPVILDVIHDPAIPHSNDSVTVTARLRDESAEGMSATLYYRIPRLTGFLPVPMHDDGSHGDGAAGDGVFAATIPPQPDGRVVEFYVEASDGGGLSRAWPAPVRDTQSHDANALYQVMDSFDVARFRIPGAPVVFHSIMTPDERLEFQNIARQSDAQMNATFISVDGTGVEVRYNAGVRIRGSNSRNHNPPNNRINIPSDNPWMGRSSLNVNAVNFENQVLGAAFHADAGLAAPDAKPVIYLSNNVNLQNGFYAHLQPLNSEFAEEEFPGDGGGNAYKGRRSNESPPGGQGAGLVYYGHGDPTPYASYFKQTNESEADWTDVMDLTYALNVTPDGTYVEDVRKIVDVDQWLRYFALHALMDNNEGGLVNGDRQGDDYAMYHGQDDPRFFLLPHDLDTLFGDVSRSILRPTNVPALNRMFSQPEFTRLYYANLVDLMDDVFSPENIDRILAESLRGSAGSGRVNSIRTFLLNRVNYVRGLIPSQLTVQHGLPVSGGYPRADSEFLLLTGTLPTVETHSLMVNGYVVPDLPNDGTWRLGPSVGVEETLIDRGAVWRFLDDGSNQGTAWRQRGFDASPWDSGPAELGYGDGNERTEVNGGPLGNRFITTYFRHEFDVDDAERYGALTVNLMRDDGAVVYLNGQELFRDNMPAGAINYLTPAASVAADESRFYSFELPPAALVDGLNVLAVEIHQSDRGSSDISFDLELRAARVDQNATGMDPGLNRVVVRAMDAAEGAGSVIAERIVDVWYDPPQGGQNVSGGVIATDTRWTSQQGPYHVLGDVTVGAGATLTIDPGTTVFFHQNTGLTFNGGRLVAEGLPDRLVRFALVPGLPGSWNGIRLVGSMQDNRVSHAVIERAVNNQGMLRLEDSRLMIDGVSFERSDRLRIGARDSSLAVRNSAFSDVLTGGGAPVGAGLHGQIDGEGVPDDGFWIIEDNTFGATRGANAIVRFVGSESESAPIPRITGNRFLGGGDDGIQVLGHVLIEGNRFERFRRDLFNTETGHANAIAVSGAAVATIVRNEFLDVDHAVLADDGMDLRMINNTIVTTAMPTVHFQVPGVSLSPARSALLEGLIAHDVQSLLDNSAGTDVTLRQSFVPAENVGDGTGNLAGDPLFWDVIGGDLRLRPYSPARGTGPEGRDMGADVPPGASVVDVPRRYTSRTEATVTVGGPGIVSYRYRLDEGAWSAPRPVEVPIVLTGLADGDHMLYTIGQDVTGHWQRFDEANSSPLWTVDRGLSRLVINEVLAINDGVLDYQNSFPDAIELHYMGATTLSLTGMSLSDDPDEPRKFVFPPGLEMAPGDYLTLYADDEQSPGIHIGFSLSGSGEGVYLYDSPASSGVLLDSVRFGLQLPNLSIGRVDRDGHWTLTSPSLGGPNVVHPLSDAGGIVINEWFANGDVRLEEDFLELHNPAPRPVDIGGFYLSDHPEWSPRQHQLPPLSFIGADQFLALQADGDTEAGADHLNFSLSSIQEIVALYDRDANQLDRIYFFPQTTDFSQGRAPDDGDMFRFFRQPTPGAANSPVDESSPPLLGLEDSWRYEQSGLDLGNLWRQPGFDDGDWPEGLGGFASPGGFTPVVINTSLDGTAATTYFRGGFQVEQPVSDLALDLVAGDGAVVYVNGREIHRERMPTTDITYLTTATRGVGDASVSGPWRIPAETLVAGENLIAVELHQSRDDCGDALFAASVRSVESNPRRLYDQALTMYDALRVTEIMYNPSGGGGAGEYLELANVGRVPLDLTGVRIRGGIEFDFPPTGLAPGEHVVLVGDVATFERTYGTGHRIVGRFSGDLGNGGDEIVVLPSNPYDSAILRFDYDNWYPPTDGGGFAIELVSENARPEDMDEPESWQVGWIEGGTPGRGPLSVSVDFACTADRTPMLSGTVSEPTATVEVGVAGDVLIATNNGDGTWTLSGGQWNGPLPVGTLNVTATASVPAMGQAADETFGELTIVEDTSAPQVRSIVVNGGLVDPPDLPDRPPQTSDWRLQHSDIRTIVVEFSKDVLLDASDLRLVNLGVNAPVDIDREIPLNDAQVQLTDSTMVMAFGAFELPDGAYRLTIRDSVTDLSGRALDGDGDGAAGGDHVVSGHDVSNRLYKIAGDFNGDEGVSLFDFGVFAYWFAQAVTVHGGAAPEYVDLNHDGGVSIFDLAAFAANFGRGVVFSTPAAGLAPATFGSPVVDPEDETRRPPVDSARPAPTRRADIFDLALAPDFASPRDRSGRALDDPAAEDRPDSLDVLLELLARGSRLAACGSRLADPG